MEIKSYAELMTAIEAYYGQYDNDFKRNIMFEYVSHNFKLNELADVFKKLRQNYTSKYKIPPGEKEFNDLFFKEDIESQAEAMWIKLENELKSDKSILCTDIVLQETIVSMGGVNQFLDYRLTQHNWCKKNFIETYIRLSKSDLSHREFKILKSKAQIDYPKYPLENFYDYDVKVIGNETQGRLMIESMKQTLGLEYKKTDILQIGEVINNIAR